jgi:hypothetical protein
MKHRSPALHSWIPVIVIVVSASLLTQMPLDRNKPPPSLNIVGTPSAAQSLTNYFATSRKTSASPYAPEYINGSKGRAVNFTLTDLHGLAEQRCELRWAELDRSDLHPASTVNWRYDDILGWPDGLFFPDADTGEFDGEIWVPEPNANADIGQQFFIRLRLLCDNEEIARADTADFQAGSNSGSAPNGPTPQVGQVKRQVRQVP